MSHQEVFEQDTDEVDIEDDRLSSVIIATTTTTTQHQFSIEDICDDNGKVDTTGKGCSHMS